MPARELVIGLVNNMPPSAKRATEAQFTALLQAASHGREVRLLVFAGPPLPGAAADPPAGHEKLEALWDTRLDGLIVTGAEPRAASMADEPFWPVLARLIDWAAERTVSTIWSCLAAHAVAYRLDGLGRQLRPRKLSGVFTCSRAADHKLLADAPPHWPVPHSRCNDLDEAALRAAGYLILSRSSATGADSFVKDVGGSLFLLLQGHPEYGADSLLGEYRRDVRRFLGGERPTHPDLPENYFADAVAAALAALRKQALRRPDPALLAAVDAAIGTAPPHRWHAPAVRLYANWLALVAARRDAAPPLAARAMPQRRAS